MRPFPQLLILLATLCSQPSIFSQTPDLFTQLQAADSLLFEESFNRCNLAAIEPIIHPDLEFLHDKGGVSDREGFFKAVKENICSSPDFKPIRKLVPGSLEVFPLYDNGVLYAAIQMGRHDFYIQEPGKPLRLTNHARFIHTWFWEDGRWQLKRVLSYDHQEP
jgi:hypothetical protein